jgi:hypothetical protein
MRIAPAIALTEAQRAQLTGYACGRKVPLRVSQRAKILLLAAAGKQHKEHFSKASRSMRLTALRRRGDDPPTNS